MKKYRYTKIVLLPLAFLICGLLQADVIQVNNKTFQTADLSGFTHIFDREGIIEAFPLVDHDYRHITHFVIYEDSDSENPVVGRFTTPTRSVGARIKPRKEFISGILSFKYDEAMIKKMRASYKELENILDKGELDISVDQMSPGLLAPVIVDHDEYGFYSVQLIQGIREGVGFQQVTIGASTVINNTFFILYVSKEFEGLQTHQELLEISKRFIAGFVQLNEK